MPQKAVTTIRKTTGSVLMWAYQKFKLEMCLHFLTINFACSLRLLEWFFNRLKKLFPKINLKPLNAVKDLEIFQDAKKEFYFCYPLRIVFCPFQPQYVGMAPADLENIL